MRLRAQELRAHRAENANVAPTAIKAYNGKAGMYEQVVQKRGQPLREGFTIVKVRASRLTDRGRTADSGVLGRPSREIRSRGS